MNGEKVFKIAASNFRWIDDSKDNLVDLCLHGDVTVKLKDELLSDSCCVSASALRMLKTLTEDHEITNMGEQMLPCCGHTLITNDSIDTVDISGCDNGVDYAVRHENENIIIFTESGNTYTIPFEEYRDEVLRFAYLVEEFYNKSSPKILPLDEWERDGYTAFWNEWERRLEQYKI